MDIGKLSGGLVVNIFYTDQIDGEYDQGNDPQCQVYDLGFQAEHQKKKDQRNYKNQDKTGTDQLWIPFFEPVGMTDGLILSNVRLRPASWFSSSV